MSRLPLPLRGIVPPVVTPLNDDLSVDYASFTRVIEHLIAGGVHGLFFLGSTSEVIFHDRETRRRILDHAAKVTNGRVPLLVGTIDPTTDRVIGLAKDAEAAGADAVVVTAPFYTRTNQAETLDHFRAIRGAIGIPVVAYDLPVSVYIKLERATVSTLAREGVVVGLKDSSGDTGNFRYVVRDMAARPEFFVMTGDELVVDGAMLAGADGCVPGLGNVDPAGYVRLYEAARRGDWVAAKAEQERLCRLFEIIFVSRGRLSGGSMGIGGFKAAMRELGIIASDAMPRPRMVLNPSERAEVRAILKDVGLL